MNAFAAQLPRLAAQLPRLVPGAVVVILGGTLLCATAARLVNFAAPATQPAPLASLALTFSDLPDGGVAVRNASTGQIAATVAARNDGFLRMTLRLLAAARLRQNIGQSQPFILTEFSGGRMRLSDPATGLAIELEAFGPSNVAEFIRLFSPEAHS